MEKPEMPEIDLDWLEISKKGRLESSGTLPQRDLSPPIPEAPRQLGAGKDKPVIKKRTARAAAQINFVDNVVSNPVSILKNGVQKRTAQEEAKKAVVQGNVAPRPGLSEQALIKVIKPTVRGEWEFGEYQRQFGAYLRRDGSVFVERLDAIRQIVCVTRDKYNETIERIEARMADLCSNKSEISGKLLQQRRRQYVLVVLKSNLRLQQLREKLVRAMFISDLEIRYAYAFRLIRYIAAVGNRLAATKKVLSTCFGQMRDAWRRRSCMQALAEEKCDAKLLAFGYNFIATQYLSAQLAKDTDSYYEFRIKRLLFFELLQKIQYQIRIRKALMGAGAERDTRELELQSASILSVKKLNVQLKLKKVNAAQQKLCAYVYSAGFLKPFSFELPEGYSSPLAERPLFAEAENSNNGIVQNLSVFKIPKIPIVSKQLIETTRTNEFVYSKELLRNLSTQKALLSQYNELLYVGNRNEPFNIKQISPEIQSLMRAAPLINVVEISANLFVMSKAFNYWNFSLKQKQFYSNIIRNIQPIFRLRRLLCEWRMNILISKNYFAEKAEYFYHTKLEEIAFAYLKELSRRVLTPEEQRRADSYFLLIFMGRMVKQWHILAEQEKSKKQNLAVFLQLLPEITLIKPVFVKWLSLTQIIVETRQKQIKLTSYDELLRQQLVFRALRRAARRAVVLRRILENAVVCWWRYEDYEQQYLARDCLLGWRECVNDKLSVKSMHCYYVEKLKKRCFEAMRLHTNESFTITILQMQHENYLVATTYYAVLRKYAFLREGGSKIQYRIKSFLLRQAFNALLFVQAVHTLIRGPLVKNDIFQKWRIYAKAMHNADYLHNIALERCGFYALKKFLHLQRIGLIIMTNHEQSLQSFALSSLLEMYVDCKEFNENREKELIELSDALYLKNLRLWSEGKKNLFSNERLWNEMDELMTNSENGGANNELKQYVKLNALQAQFEAFFEWLRECD